MKKATLIFDIGKTNKKLLLFGQNMELLYQEEQVFKEIVDDDGFACDDILKIENWIKEKVVEFANSKVYDIQYINFATYGATLVYLDKNGERLTPIYNYLKPLGEEIDTNLYNKYGGEQEFSRKTASPALKMLNSGLQILNLKQAKPEVYEKISSILHFPQYLSYLLSGKITSEATSIGCHTAMWDFDKMEYHQWLADEKIKLPTPINLDKTEKIKIGKKEIAVGIGIHDSSASLVPYLKAADKNFVLVSTGTWCINMNPFNSMPLTDEELKKDCLSYMTYEQKPVKSSRVFLGHIHDENLKQITKHFKKPNDAYKDVELNRVLLKTLLSVDEGKRVFFKNGIPVNYIDEEIDFSVFKNLEHCYHQFIIDLTHILFESIDLILDNKQSIQHLYITGGFARNQIFATVLASIYKHLAVYTTEIDNATSLGAALTINKKMDYKINLGLNQINTQF